MKTKFAVVDLFAGPGGLAEGFSAVTDVNGHRPFHIALSVEKDPAAHSTLLLRTFLRQFGGRSPDEYYSFLKAGGPEPEWKSLYPAEWASANRDTLLLELGLPSTETILEARIEKLHAEYGENTILIGGPPCQAYSLVGRSRNLGIPGYVPADDPKHFLYKNYIKILNILRPAVFVMENVKGILSSSINESLIFDRVRRDLRNAGGPAGYTLVALDPQVRQQSQLIPTDLEPANFIVRSEQYGLPQSRHRVIVVGVREDVSLGKEFLSADKHFRRPNFRTRVEDVLDGMPRLRSGLSRNDSPNNWALALKAACELVCRSLSSVPRAERETFANRVYKYASAGIEATDIWPRVASQPAGVGAECPEALKQWILDPRLNVLANNETRSHMPSDLARYLFAAVYADLKGHSPKADNFPEMLAPEHESWRSGNFVDRFRVQLRGQPSTTITSHISKDGHYFIHPDPAQCRSLTVREAARLQTFPDNYFFKGNRTEQFVQVGNAVPPFLAKQIGQAVYSILRSSSAARSSSQHPSPFLGHMPQQERDPLQIAVR